jgi:hypothetical protein
MEVAIFDTSQRDRIGIFLSRLLRLERLIHCGRGGDIERSGVYRGLPEAEAAVATSKCVA